MSDDEFIVEEKDKNVPSKSDPFSDPKRVYPKREYANSPSVNLEARGIEENELLLGGGDVGIDLELKNYPSSKAPLNQVKRTVSGHVQEVDDTPGRERMLFRHKTGAGVEMRADGTVIVNAVNNIIRVAAGNEKVIIEGDGDMVYHGNLNLRVDGDFDLNVGGNFTVTTGGDMEEDIKGGYRQDVNNNHQTFVNRNVSKTITGTETNLVLADQNNIVKGNQSTTVGVNKDDIVGSEYQISAENKYIATSPDINMGASSLTVIGDSGTMGGQNIITYNYNQYTGHSITATDTITTNTAYTTRTEATEFVGSLTGNADTATQAGRAGTAGAIGAGGSAGTKNTAAAQAVDTKATVLPTNSVMKNSWFNSAYGIFKVAVDVGDVIYNSINRFVDYGGVQNRTLTTSEVRSKLRNPATQANEDFIGTAIAENILNTTYSNAVPSLIGSIIDDEPTPRTSNPKEVFGKIKGAEAKRFAGSVQNDIVTIQPNPIYDPRRKKFITERTKLARGITVAKFLGGHGDSVTIDHMFAEDRFETAKYLYLHGQLMRSVIEDEGEFDEFRLIVSEGVYKPSETEIITAGSVNDYRTYGRAIVYELRNRKGKLALKQTFKLAAWWKDSQQYEKMILDYDTYNVDGSLNAQIIVIMPELQAGYKASYQNRLETRYNNYVQATGELIEILA